MLLDSTTGCPAVWFKDIGMPSLSSPPGDRVGLHHRSGYLASTALWDAREFVDRRELGWNQPASVGSLLDQAMAHTDLRFTDEVREDFIDPQLRPASVLYEKYQPQPSPFTLNGLTYLALTWDIAQVAAFITVVGDLWISVLYPREPFGRGWPRLVTAPVEQLARVPPTPRVHTVNGHSDPKYHGHANYAGLAPNTSTTGLGRRANDGDAAGF